MKYFSMFAWAVPASFSDALGRCQFGEGDVLYKHQSFYEQGSSPQPGTICLQVTYPARQFSAPKGDTAEVFRNHWGSELRLQRYRIGGSGSFEKESGILVSKQGNLYTSLWKGDLSFLDANTEAPMPRINIKEFARLKKRTSASSTPGAGYLEEANDAVTRLSSGHTAFSMPYDPTNNVSEAKYQKVRLALEEVMHGEPIVITPRDAGIKDSSLFLPTVYLAIFPTTINSQQLHAAVKEVTYMPGKTPDSSSNNYSIRRHGLIVTSLSIPVDESEAIEV